MTIEEYMEINKVPPIAKKEGLKFYIDQWELNVNKLFSWDKYTFDDYYAAIGKRDRINDICNKCSVEEEYLERINKIDADFMEQTESIDINILDHLSRNEDEQWYAYRLLKAHYDEWIDFLTA